MNTGWHRHGLLRWAKFNAVGALGFGVQICATCILFAVTNEPLLSTALAVETSVLHNFTWHYFLTWKDPSRATLVDFPLRLLAFNLTNVIISLTGNLLFAWLIVEHQHASAILASLSAITTCSLINFVLCDKFVFRIATNRNDSCEISTCLRRTVQVIAFVIFCCEAGANTARARDAASPKFTLFAGPRFFKTEGISRGEVQTGVSLDEAGSDAWGGVSLLDLFELSSGFMTESGARPT